MTSPAADTADRENDVYNKRHRQSLAQLVTQLFERWELSNAQQLELLGIPSGSASTLARYRRGEPLAATRDLIERVGHLLAIHKSLRLYFPENRSVAYRWMTTRNADFDNHTPMEMVQQYGFAGLLMVRSYLDRIRGE